MSTGGRRRRRAPITPAPNRWRKSERGVPEWKKSIGDYHRSLAKSGIYRFKQLFGEHLTCCQFETQVTEMQIRVVALKVMTDLGMPVSVPVGGNLP